MFNRELDLLEIRLNVLKDVVDKFYIVELDKTHSGRVKDQVFTGFEDFPIEYQFLSAPNIIGPVLEAWHRQQTKPHCSNDDIIIMSDLDEIPNPDLIARRVRGRYIQKMYYFYLNTYAYEWFAGPVVMSGGESLNQSFQHIRSTSHCVNRTNLPLDFPFVENGGWHFSSVGTKEDVIIKMQSTMHMEYGSEEGVGKVLDWRSKLQDIGGSSLTVVAIDESYPQYIQDNQEKYSHLIYE